MLTSGDAKKFMFLPIRQITTLLFLCIASVSAACANDFNTREADIAQASSAFAAHQNAPTNGCRTSASHEKVTCKRGYAIDQLARISALAEESQLYDFAPKAAANTGALFDLGSTAVIQDDLARQLARVRVIVQYAVPYLEYLLRTDPAGEIALQATAVSYWDNTKTELDRFIQAREPDGQVARLEDLVRSKLAIATMGNCDALSGAGNIAPEFGNDLFSSKRAQLLTQAQLICAARLQNYAYQQLLPLFARFDHDLAGRYPFGTANAPDADPAIVAAFLQDYAAQKEAFRTYLKMLHTPQQIAMDRFLDQLDALVRSLAGALVVNEPAQGTAVTVKFNPLTQHAQDASQIVRWQFMTGPKEAVSAPNSAPTTLHWIVGHGIRLELEWASRSSFLPSVDPKQNDLSVDTNTASFVEAGPWALLRMIEAHQPHAPMAKQTALPPRYLLEFIVPTTDQAQHLSVAYLYMELRTDMPLSSEYPHSAP